MCNERPGTLTSQEGLASLLGAERRSWFTGGCGVSPLRWVLEDDSVCRLEAGKRLLPSNSKDRQTANATYVIIRPYVG